MVCALIIVSIKTFVAELAINNLAMCCMHVLLALML